MDDGTTDQQSARVKQLVQYLESRVAFELAVDLVVEAIGPRQWVADWANHALETAHTRVEAEGESVDPERFVANIVDETIRVRKEDENTVLAFLELGETRKRTASFAISFARGDKRLAEDWVQEVLIHAWTKAGKYDRRRGDPGAWFYTLRYRKLCTLYELHQMDFLNPERTVELDDKVHKQSHSLDRLLDLETMRQLQKVLDSMPFRESQIFRMRHGLPDGNSPREWAGVMFDPDQVAMQFREIAFWIGRSLSTVHECYSKARKKFEMQYESSDGAKR